MAGDADNPFTEAGAGRLARKVERYWRKRGHPGVNVWVEPVFPDDPDCDVFQVRSDLVGGLPRAADWIARLAA
jgi:hypothetical protein